MLVIAVTMFCIIILRNHQDLGLIIREGKYIYIYFSFGQNLPFALPPSYQELRQMLFCELSTVS